MTFKSLLLTFAFFLPFSAQAASELVCHKAFLYDSGRCARAYGGAAGVTDSWSALRACQANARADKKACLK